ncbi:branched-chain amino acid ABC transporter permease [Bordetella sputigena]|uniref:branched-chain amino acid ABC transporter permease n=1 Tax=Bordetella sputigena TaxID=1416810 RepID=UPI0039F0269A
MKKTFLACLAGVVLLAALPYLLSQGLLNAAIQMLIAALFATAYNLLCGQAGMLSFGHAAYFGIGAFATVHAMNALGGEGLLPTPLMPLAGAAGGLIFGGIAGWFATQRSGTYFAMITLAIAELVHSLAPHLKSTFGGEAGISTMRMPAWGLDFGSTTQVYYLTLFWVLLAMLLMYLYTRTPLGRLTLGLRENSHRLRFLGYNVHGLSTLVFAISAMFAGMAGGLQVLSNESANYVVFDPALSAAAVLNTYIGGVGVFLGPALGASLMTFFGYAVSDLTRSWLLYQGILFVIVMMFLPRGLAGLFVRPPRPAQASGPGAGTGTATATAAPAPAPGTASPAPRTDASAARGRAGKEMA